MRQMQQKEDEILKFIREYIQDEGIAPSIREICSGAGFRSTSTVHRYLRRLRDEGKIKMADGKNRTIVLTGEKQGIPLVGAVAAGVPITALENVEDYVDYTPRHKHEGALFALRVKGESMINIGMLDGDVIIVEQTPVAENGDVVVALVDGSEATVKRFYKEKRHYRLQPENDSMEPIIVKDVELLGKVVSLIREDWYHQ